MTLGIRLEKDVIDRLVQLEDMKREAELITTTSLVYMDRQKVKLIEEGKGFTYQQGALDAWEQMMKVLDGKTNFHEFVGEMKDKIKAERERNPMEIG